MSLQIVSTNTALDKVRLLRLHYPEAFVALGELILHHGTGMKEFVGRISSYWLKFQTRTVSFFVEPNPLENAPSLTMQMSALLQTRSRPLECS